MRSHRLGRGLSVLAAVIVLPAVGSAAAETSPSDAPTTSEAVAASDQSIRTVPRRTGPASLPSGMTGSFQGLQTPEFRGTERPADERSAAPAAAVEGAGRSHSPRPGSGVETSRLAEVPVAASTPLSSVTTGISRNFEGLNLFQQRFANNGNQFTVEPPDQGLCVGNGDVLETVNTVLRVFGTDGRPKTDPIDLNSFYGYPSAIDRTTGVFGPFLTDPNCYWDPTYQRWIHVALTIFTDPATGDFTLDNSLDIAVSRTPNPLGAWDFFSIPVQNDGTDGTPSHVDCPCIGDYPQIGADNYGFYITTNEYPWSSDPGKFGNNFNGAQLYAFSRKQLTSAPDRLQVVQFENLTLRGRPNRVAGFTLMPTRADQGSDPSFAGTEHFLSSTAAVEALGTGASREIGHWQLRGTRSLDAAQPDLTLVRRVLPSQLYGVPPLSDQRAGPTPLRDCVRVECMEGIGPNPERLAQLDSGDSRFYQTWWSAGRVWGALATIVQVGDGVQAGTAWFGVNPRGGVDRQGYLATADANVIYPALATLASGSGAMVVSLVGPNHFPSLGYVAFDGGPVGPLRIGAPGVGPQDGFCGYDFFNCAGTDPPTARPRWGDYSAATVDAGRIWLATEYIAQRCTFNQWLADPTCGGTRAALGNWSTRLVRFRP
jgi:hypothetical protein